VIADLVEPSQQLADIVLWHPPEVVATKQMSNRRASDGSWKYGSVVVGPQQKERETKSLLDLFPSRSILSRDTK
jgi:hypothetical protein